MPSLLQYHQWLLSDFKRTSSYRDAIDRIVREDDVVLDVGSGTGILSFFACLAGARKVYAVEQSDAIELAKEICAASPFRDRIEFLNERSQNVKLPEAVDVIVTDTGASFGLQDGTIGSLLDTRQRFLKPGGKIIPESLNLFLAPVELRTPNSLDVWNENRYDLNLSPVRRFATNTNYHISLEPEYLLGSPGQVASISFLEVSSLYVEGEARSVVRRDGTVHGLGAWNSVNLTTAISFNNSPINPTVDWARSFFPIETPTVVRAGDAVSTKISTYNGQQWRWQVEIYDGDPAKSRNATLKVRFDHSTLNSFPIRPEQLKKKLPTYAPKLSRKGEAEAYVLRSFRRAHSERNHGRSAEAF